MQSITASFAKQNFGQALTMCADGPVRIERHRKTVAGLVSPRVLAGLDLSNERRAARLAQQRVELSRLLWHQRLSIELLCLPASERRKILLRASDEVQRWQDQRLCSADYIDRWRKWLALDLRQLARTMCGDADGWGNAMRQNSPFRAAMPTA